MSLGCRIASRGKGAVSFSTKSASTSREPLHFLYPRWFGTTVGVAPEGDGGLVPSQHDGDLELKAKRTGSSGSHSQGPTSEVAAQSKDDITNSTKFDATEPLGATDRDQDKLKRPKSTPQSSSPLLSDEKFRRTSSRVRRRVENRETDKAVRLAGAKVYHLERLSESGLLPDWRVVLQHLRLHTPEQTSDWRENGLRILVPDAAIGVLLYDASNNIWKIKARCVCEIELLEIDRNVNGQRVLILSGPTTGIRSASLEILRIADGAITSLPIIQAPAHRMGTSSVRHLDGGDENAFKQIRFVRAEKSERMERPISADAVPKPEVWTRNTLEQYIKHLTSIKMPSHRHSMLYNANESHQESVQQIILSVFADKSCQCAMTVSALNTAIAWSLAHGQVRNTRILFMHAERQGLDMEVETFNIMLRSAAKSLDLRNFMFILKTMVKRDIHPNCGTWLAFYRCVDDPTVKQYILEGMKKKGLLLDLKTLRAVCEELAPNEIRWSLEQGHSHAEFVAHMDRRYGTNWLSTSSGNKILRQLGDKGLLGRIWKFLELMISRIEMPDVVTINTILVTCRDIGDMDIASTLVSKITAINHWTPDETTYKLLFDIARATNCLSNVENIVWRYACLDASTSFPLRKKVQEIMRRTAKEAKSEKSTVLSQIVGTYQPLSASESSPGPSNLEASVTDFGDDKGDNPPASTLGLGKRNIVKEAMWNQLSVCKDWRPRDSLADALQQALAIDKKLLARGGQPASTFMKRPSLVPVTLIRRDSPKAGEPEMCIWT